VEECSTESPPDGPHLRVVMHRATAITQPMPEAYRAKIDSAPGVTRHLEKGRLLPAGQA